MFQKHPLQFVWVLEEHADNCKHCQSSIGKFCIEFLFSKFRVGNACVPGLTGGCLKHALLLGKCSKLEVAKDSYTLPETNSSHLSPSHPKRKRSSSNHPFSGAKIVVSGSVYNSCAFWVCLQIGATENSSASLSPWHFWYLVPVHDFGVE